MGAYGLGIGHKAMHDLASYDKPISKESKAGTCKLSLFKSVALVV
jgi:hypothetical protein